MYSVVETCIYGEGGKFMFQKQIQDILSELPEDRNIGIQNHDDAVLCLDRMDLAYSEAEKKLPSFLEDIKNRKYISTEELRETAVCISSVYSQAELLESYAEEQMPDMVKKGSSLDEIRTEIENLRAFDEKYDILIRMGYVRFADRDVNSVYDPVRLDLKKIAMLKKDESGLIERVETLEHGFETDDQPDMVGVFRTLSGKFDARILSNILVKNFTFHGADRNILIRGFGLDDDRFLSLVYDADGPYEKYFIQVPDPVPVEEEPEYEEEPVCEKDGIAIPEEPETADTCAEQDEETGKHPDEGNREKSAEKSVKNSSSEKSGTKKKRRKDRNTAAEKKTEEIPENPADRADTADAGSSAEDDSHKEGTASDENPAVTAAYSLLKTEGGGEAALASIGEATNTDENLLFVEEQMQYAFGAVKEENTAYSYDRLLDVFGETQDNADLFGAAVLAYAFSSVPVYEFDYMHTEELIEKKFSDRKTGDDIRSLFYSLCRFKEENGQSMTQCISGGDRVKSVTGETDEMKKKAMDFRKTVSASYQPNNPFLEIMTKIGYTEIYELLDAFADSDSPDRMMTVYSRIDAFLSENALTCEDKKNGETVPDTDGINAYKDAVWNRYSAMQENRKQRYNLSGMNDFGKSKNVNRLYRTGVSLLIGCMETAQKSACCNSDGYARAKKEAPGIIRRLGELTGNGYRAIDYMANRYAEMLKDA